MVLGKVEEPEVILPTSTGSSKKQEGSRKASISAFLTTPKHRQHIKKQRHYFVHKGLSSQGYGFF